MNRLIVGLRQGIRRVKENPQLLYTLFVACMIFVAFTFIANRFVGIAHDAQDRLVNVRIGAIQDSLYVLAADHLDDPAYLQSKIEALSTLNETIQTFRMIRIDGPKPRVIASLQKDEIGTAIDGDPLLYSLAKSDPTRSFTVQDVLHGERVYKTVRYLTHGTTTISVGEIIVESSESLSEADRAIDNNIRTSIFIFIGIIILIMFLFFRHSRIIDYTVLYRRLKEVDQLKDDFISMASHELRTPLTLIRGYAESVREEGTQQVQSYGQMIDDAAKQLDGLVADILDVSRIEQGRMNFSLQSIDIGSLIEKTVERYKQTASTKSLALSVQTEKNILVNVDETRFNQIIVNLVGNAIKYTKQGSINVSLKHDELHAIIRISDTGIGMSAEDQKKLFQKFYRIKNSDTEGISGTGLGLWITAQLVEKMRGSISVESIQGKGSDFVVIFPLSDK